jgi:ubiquinol-cytochrome c reductase cytochrome c subunit
MQKSFTRMRAVLTLVVAGGLLAGVAIGINDVAAAASAEKGKAAFVAHGCWQCHGFEGQGAVTGKTLAPDPIPFEALVAFVRSTDRAMPPYRESILPDADLADIYAYLQSIPKAKDYKTIPLLNR